MNSRILLLTLALFMLHLAACSPAEKEWRLTPAGEVRYVITEVTVPDESQERQDTIITGIRLKQTGSVAKEYGEGRNLLFEVVSERQGAIDSIRFTCDIYGRISAVHGADQATTNLFTRLFFYIPAARTVKAGDTWTSEFTLNTPIPEKHMNMITVQEIKGDTVVMGLNTVVSVLTNVSESVSAQGMLKGTISASLSTGLLYHCSLKGSVMKRDNPDEKSEHTFIIQRQ
ncbi:MAG: hypothetical protein J7621_17680 [Niastella sp.]|nr:hypothetical protein [Niastella sp.]